MCYRIGSRSLRIFAQPKFQYRVSLVSQNRKWRDNSIAINYLSFFFQRYWRSSLFFAIINENVAQKGDKSGFWDSLSFSTFFLFDTSQNYALWENKKKKKSKNIKLNIHCSIIRGYTDLSFHPYRDVYLESEFVNKAVYLPTGMGRVWRSISRFQYV